jgi:hypothetical protein
MNSTPSGPKASAPADLMSGVPFVSPAAPTVVESSAHKSNAAPMFLIMADS